MKIKFGKFVLMGIETEYKPKKVILYDPEKYKKLLFDFSNSKSSIYNFVHK